MVAGIKVQDRTFNDPDPELGNEQGNDVISEESLQNQPQQRLRKQVCKKAREEQMKYRLLIEKRIPCNNGAFNEDRDRKRDDHFFLRERRIRKMAGRMTSSPARQPQRSSQVTGRDKNGVRSVNTPGPNCGSTSRSSGRIVTL